MAQELNSNGNAEETNRVVPTLGQQVTRKLPEFAWTVDNHTDTVRKRKWKIAIKEMFWIDGKTRRYEIFASEREAWQYVEQRAFDLISVAEANLAAAKARHKKCNKRLNGLFRL